MNWIEKILFLPLKFTLLAKEEFILPAYKGATFRGGFGYVFKKTVCAARFVDECKKCILNSSCVYAYIFETPRPKNSQIMRKYEHIPHPFVLCPPPGRERLIRKNDYLEVEIVLIGKAIEYLPYFVLVMSNLAEQGLGADKGKCELTEVTLQYPNQNRSTNGQAMSIYTSKNTTIELNASSLSVTSLLQNFPEGKQISLEFVTPLKLMRDGQLITRELSFKDIIRNLLRRIRLLAYFHCGVKQDELELDFAKLISLAEKIKVVEDNLKWFSFSRYSTRQRQRIPAGGLVGKISFWGELKPFWDFLLLGQYLNVGKNTSFGLGRYKLIGPQ